MQYSFRIIKNMPRLFAVLALALLSVVAPPVRAEAQTAGSTRSSRLDVMIVLDTSERLYGGPLKSAKQAAAEYVNSLPASVRVGIMTYGQFATVVRDFSNNKTGAIATIASLETNGRTPSLYDAVVLASDQFNQTDNLTKRQVVLVSDGKDLGSKSTLTDALATFERLNVRIDALRVKTSDGDPVALSRLTGTSGGAVMGATDQVGIRNLSAIAAEWSMPPKPAMPITPAKFSGFFSSKIALGLGLLAIFVALARVSMIVTKPRPKKVQLLATPDPKTGGSTTPLTGVAANLTNVAERYLENRGKTRGLNSALERAGLNMRPGEWIMVKMAAVAVFAALGFTVFSIFGAIGGLVVGMFMTRKYLKRRGTKRSNKFGDQLSDVLQLLSSSLRAGQGLMQAMDSVAKEADAPASVEFQRIVTESRLGRDVVDSLRATSDRVQCEDFNWVIPAIEINREVGGDLAEVLDTVAATIRDRADIRRQVKTLSAEGRMSAYVLLALPIGIAIMVQGSNPEYIKELTYGLGLWVAAGGILLMIIGGTWLFKLCKIEF